MVCLRYNDAFWQSKKGVGGLDIGGLGDEGVVRFTRLRGAISLDYFLVDNFNFSTAFSIAYRYALDTSNSR